MKTKMLEEIHPGEILLEEFMKPKKITARQLSADIDVPPSSSGAMPFGYCALRELSDDGRSNNIRALIIYVATEWRYSLLERDFYRWRHI